MKAPSLKPHVLISDEPHPEGENYLAPCGHRIVKARMAKTWEPGADLRMTDFRGVCWDCLKKVSLADFLRGKRISLAVDGQESLPVRKLERETDG
jgi:hypothetical protein